MVFDPYFFVTEKPSPKTPTCSVINFHNLQSLLGLFGSLVSEQTESSDWCCFCGKKIASSERPKGKIEDFLQKKKPARCLILSSD